MFERVLFGCGCILNVFGFLGLVTFSEEQTTLTVCSSGRIERCWKERVRLASDRSATYVFFFRVNFMELKLFGLLSFGFSFGRNGMGELFLVMLCNQKEACLRCLLR